MPLNTVFWGTFVIVLTVYNLLLIQIRNNCREYEKNSVKTESKVF